MVDRRARRFLIALGIYVVVVATYFAVIPRNRILEHTPYNHFALLAEAWLRHRLDLGGPPPSYAMNNDFAAYGGKWFVVFPPFPSVLLVPFVAWGKSADNVRDAQVFLWISGIAPAVLFLALEKLRRMGSSERTTATNAALALLFAFGSVYFFTALQGSVWFAAHIVGAAIGAFYLLFALDAERPLLAGLMIGLGFVTRTPLLFAAPLFVFEAFRVALLPIAVPATENDAPRAPTRWTQFKDFVRRLDKRKLAKLLVLFAIPVIFCVGAAFAHNRARFGKLTDFGYEYLTVAWQGRMRRWGLFNYHFLARNLGVVLTGLPFHDPQSAVPFQINEHGLALWVTTPLFLWLIWPKKVTKVGLALYVTALAVAIPGLFYQNTGWMQFGYRFSNDYAVFLFALLAVTGHKFGKLFWAAAAWSIAVNSFGAATFDRGEFKKYYFEDASQKIFYEND
jgi:hypothetical protein